MNCCQCQGIEELFSPELVQKELKDYLRKGPSKTTRLLTQTIRKAGVTGMTLLDIGGGVGAIQHDLFKAGVEQATDVDASSAYLAAAEEEAKRRGIADRIHFLHGDFTSLAPKIPPADIVTLDRVICCYHNMQKLVDLSAQRARVLYGVVYPRDIWWVKAGLVLGNLFFRLWNGHYQAFVHPTAAVDEIIRSQGFQPIFQQRTLVWQVIVYRRT